MLLACSLGVFAITQQGILPKLGLQQQLVEAEGLLRAGWGRSGGGRGSGPEAVTLSHCTPRAPWRLHVHEGCRGRGGERRGRTVERGEGFMRAELGQNYLCQ